MTLTAYAINHQPCSSEAFYAAACDPQRHIVVQACAGAGKTWMLVSRILRALLQGSAPHEILAITFTKKAAGEMRERLHAWLHEFASASDDKLMKELLIRGISKEKALQATPNLRQQLSNLYQQSLNAMRPVQIRTFHSWFAALLAASPIAVVEALGLPMPYELLEVDAQAVAQVWPRFYVRLQADEALHHSYREAVADVGRWGVQEALSNALAKRVEFELADAAGVVAGSIPPFTQVFPAYAHLQQPFELLAQEQAALQEAAQLLAKAPQPSYAAKGSELLAALQAQAWEAVPLCLLTLQGEPRKFSDKIAGIESIRAMQQLCMQVHSMQVQHAAWQHQQRMAQLTRALIQCLADVKRLHGWVDMNDLERAARHLLSDAQLSGWVQQRLDAQIKHLLIDEFQDTNPLQWQALQSWLSGYGGAGASMPSLFIVGDAKQSIYRFRRAEPQVFEAATRFICEGLGGSLLACDHTRRNAQGVISVVNALMGQAAEHEAYAFREHTTESHEEGRVLCLPLAPLPEKATKSDELIWRDTLTEPRDTPEEHAIDAECELAARWLAGQVAQGVAAQDIMVLARKRDRLTRMRDALRRLGLNSQITEKTALHELPEVQDLVALLDALVSPTNDLALARALKSPLFAWRDEDLIALVRLQQTATAFKPSWFELLQNQELLARIPPGLQADLFQKTALQLQQAQHLLHSLPPHDALHAIYEQLDVLARCVAASPAPLRSRVQQSLQALLHAALQSGGGRFLTPHAWVREIKSATLKAPPATTQSQALRLMTIHGAKGLEAHTVLLLDTNHAAQKARFLDVLVDWPGEKTAPQTFAFLRSESSAPACVSNALAHEQAQRAREDINTFYVAMTRAKHQLVFSGHEMRKVDEHCPWLRLQTTLQSRPDLQELVQEAWHGDFAAPSSSAAAQEAVFSMKKLPETPVEYALAATKNVATATTDNPPDDSAARIGQCLHRLLELYRPGDDLAALCTHIAPTFALNPEQASQALHMAQSITQGPAAWVWNEAVIDFAANEVELLHQGQLLRIDRLVKRADTQAWWVLDYKSAAHPEQQAELQAQLARYAQAVSECYPGQAVQAAFINGVGELLEIGATLS